LAAGWLRQTGVAIDNARLFEALRREWAQARAENQYRLAAETLPHMVDGRGPRRLSRLPQRAR